MPADEKKEDKDKISNENENKPVVTPPVVTPPSPPSPPPASTTVTPPKPAINITQKPVPPPQANSGVSSSFTSPSPSSITRPPAQPLALRVLKSTEYILRPPSPRSKTNPVRMKFLKGGIISIPWLIKRLLEEKVDFVEEQKNTGAAAAKVK